jgi:hypothetical protein
MGYQPPPIETYRWPDGTPHCGNCHEQITSHDVSCPHCGNRFTRRSPLKFGGYTSRDMLPEKIEQEPTVWEQEIEFIKSIDWLTGEVKRDIAVREQEPTVWEQASNLVMDIHRMRSEAEQNITFIEQELAATRTRIKEIEQELPQGSNIVGAVPHSDNPLLNRPVNRKLDIDTYR